MFKIYVANLPYTANEEDLRTLFGEFGTIEDVIIIRHRDSGKSKGFGFVQFADQASAEKALTLDGQMYQERPLRVSEAREKKSTSR